MKFLEKIYFWILCRVSPHHPAQPDLLTAIQNSLTEWNLSKKQFNFIDPELIDYMVYRLNAAERHYAALLAQAKNQGLKAWPDQLRGEIREVRCERREADL